MNRFASAIAALVLISAAAPVAAQDGRIRVNDLNLSTSSGAAELDARIGTLARTMCRDARSVARLISDQAFCRDAVRREVMLQLPSSARQDYARARASRIAA